MKDTKVGGVLLGLALPKAAKGTPSTPDPAKKNLPAPPPVADGADELGMAAAEEAIMSLKKGNARGLWESFKAMKEACEMSYGEEE